MKRFALVLALVVLARGAFARAASSSDEGEGAERPPSLRSRVGVPAALAFLTSSDKAERVRGLERLGATGTPRALFQLVRAVAPNGSAISPEERLTAVRQLASFSGYTGSGGDEGARRALAFVLAGHLSPDIGDEQHPLDQLAEGTAALALARSAAPDAIVVLGKALSTSGSSSRHALAALLAYPPRDLSLLLKSVTIPSVAFATLLGDLGDQRGLEPLRELVRRAPLPVRAAAAVSLTRLGDYEAVALARKWSAPAENPALRVAGARILLLARDRDAGRVMAGLVDAEETADAGLALAAEMPDAAVAAALGRRLHDANQVRAFVALEALGSCATLEAVQLIERALESPLLESRAAEALSRMRVGAARVAIERALRVSALRRTAVRAAAARFYLLGEEVSGSRAARGELARSPNAADRAAAASAEGLTAPEKIWPLLWSNDAAVSTAGRALLLASPPGVPEAVAADLPRGAPGAAIVLALPSGRRAAATASLGALASAMEVATPLSVHALAARDDPRLRDVTRSFLESNDATIRAHAAAGLSESRERDAVGLLSERYRFEADARVRRAIVSALSRLPGSGRGRILSLAASLDPDVPTRATARIALAGTRVREPSTGSALVWLHRDPRAAPASGATRAVKEANDTLPPTARAVELPSGLTVPVVPNPDGEALIPGLPAGSHAVRVAPEEKADDARERGKSGSEKSSPGSRAQ